MIEIYDAQEFLEDPVRDRVIRGTVSCVPEARGKIRLRALGGIQAPRHVTIRFTADSFRGNVVIGVGPGPASCVVASAGPVVAQINLWRDARVAIGRGTTINAARIIADAADLTVGQDNLWSDEIIIQTSDQHGLIDLSTDRLLIPERGVVATGDHVWLGRRSLVLPNVRIGDGSTVGAGSVVTRSVDPFCVVAGNPARVLRENTTWSRSPDGFSSEEEAWVAAHRPKL